MNTSVTFNIQRDTSVDNINLDKFKEYDNPVFDEIIEEYKKYRFNIKNYVEKDLLKIDNNRFQHLK